MDEVEPLVHELLSGGGEQRVLPADHVVGQDPFAPPPIPLQAHPGWHVEHDRNGRAAVPPGQLEQPAPVRSVHVRRVHDDPEAAPQPLVDDRCRPPRAEQLI